MRKPSPAHEIYAWHTRALAHFTRHGSMRTFENGTDANTPECGWYKRRLVKDGPYVPCAIWMEQPVDEDGELTGPERLRGEVNGRESDPLDMWTWVCGNPISEKQYRLMHAESTWAKTWAPNDPIANPTEKIDPAKMPLPW